MFGQWLKEDSHKSCTAGSYWGCGGEVSEKTWSFSIKKRNFFCTSWSLRNIHWFQIKHQTDWHIHPEVRKTCPENHIIPVYPLLNKIKQWFIGLRWITGLFWYFLMTIKNTRCFYHNVLRCSQLFLQCHISFWINYIMENELNLYPVECFCIGKSSFPWYVLYRKLLHVEFVPTAAVARGSCWVMESFLILTLLQWLFSNFELLAMVVRCVGRRVCSQPAIILRKCWAK
jgi:hypothetical protein